MGAIRDLILFKQTHLFGGLVALGNYCIFANLVLGQFNAGFVGQPVAHNMHSGTLPGWVWQVLLLPSPVGCPGRQLFLSGEGDGDASVL
jgi:uncharacterized protein